MFKTKYRIVNHPYFSGRYITQRKVWWFPFWVRWPAENAFRSRAEAKRELLKCFEVFTSDSYEALTNNTLLRPYCPKDIHLD